MAVQYSVTVRNAQLAAVETVVGTAPRLRMYHGAAMPADCATAPAGTVAVDMTLPSDWMAAESDGSKSKSGTWQDASADASGMVRYWRMYDSGLSACHMQGLIYQAWQASTVYALNQQVSNGGNVYICTTAGTSASSGGPTGTGTGITDGSAVWSYVGAAEGGIQLDNVNVAAGQSVTISTFTLTAGNA